MRLPLLLMSAGLAAAPLATVPFSAAHAQDAPVIYASQTWPVTQTGGICSMIRKGTPETGFGRLEVHYNPARQEVTLVTTETFETALAEGETIQLDLVFLDNGRNKHDDQWGSRNFAHTASGAESSLAARFAGKSNVNQLLNDLSASRRLGLLRDGEVLFDHALAGVRPALDRLRDCGARNLAAR